MTKRERAAMTNKQNNEKTERKKRKDKKKKQRMTAIINSNINLE